MNPLGSYNNTTAKPSVYCCLGMRWIHNIVYVVCDYINGYKDYYYIYV